MQDTNAIISKVKPEIISHHILLLPELQAFMEEAGQVGMERAGQSLPESKSKCFKSIVHQLNYYYHYTRG
jgi:hypothetical protein